MELTAVFEAWYVPDGNYPPLARGQVVRLTFEMQPASIRPCPGEPPAAVRHLGDAEYRVTGRVLRAYAQRHAPLTVVEAGGLRFYVEGERAPGAEPGAWVDLEGTLLVDHYAWAEYWNRYADPPDLFYTLRVARIRKVQVPERFIQRHARGKAMPTRVAPSEFGPVEDIESMEGQPFDEEFYLVDLDDRGIGDRTVPPTFIGAPTR